MLRKSLTILFLCSVCPGANEIRTFQTSGNTYYAVIREVDGDVWHVVDQQFEVWGTDGNDADDYDISLTDKSGGMFVGDFDGSVPAGFYHLTIYRQAGGVPVDGDNLIDNSYGYWSGTGWSDNITWDMLTSAHSATGSFAEELQKLDPNITAVVADTNELQADWADGGRLDTIIDAVAADTDELQEDWADGGRLDLLIDAIKAVTDRMMAVSTTVAAPNDANNFTITAGLDANDVYEGMYITIQDADDSHYETRMIDVYASGRDVTVETDFNFTPAAADPVYIWNRYFPLEVYDTILTLYPGGPGYIIIDERDKRP